MATRKTGSKKAATKAPVPAKVKAPAKRAKSFAPPELDPEDEDLGEEDAAEEEEEDAYDEDEDEPEDKYEEYDEEEDEDEPPPPPRRRSRESRKAPQRPIKRVNMSQFDSDPNDPTDHVPDFHGGQDIFTRDNSKVIEVVAERTGYDNFQLREPGEVFEIRVLYAKDAEGKNTKKFQRGGVGGIPEWCCLKHEYRAPEVDLPGTQLAKGRRRGGKRVPSVRGGATGMREL